MAGRLEHALVVHRVWIALWKVQTGQSARDLAPTFAHLRP